MDQLETWFVQQLWCLAREWLLAWTAKSSLLGTKDAAVLHFALRKFSKLCSFAQALSTMPCYCFGQSAFNGESNNPNWEPVDYMVPELWPFFYRHARRKIYWARLAINCLKCHYPASACSSWKSGTAYYKVLIKQRDLSVNRQAL